MSTTQNCKYKNTAITAAIITMLIGVVVVLGWLWDIDTLKSIYGGLVSMKFNTALCLILLGLAFYIKTHNKKDKIYFLPVILSCVVCLFGIMSFLQLFGFDFAIDELFIKDNGDFISGESNPGRMSPLTSFCFTCGGLALTLIATNPTNKNNIKISLLLLYSVTLVSSVALLGYLFSIPHLYNYSSPNSMALHTCFAFIIFSLGATFLFPNNGLAGLFTGTGIGNIMARKLSLWIVPCVLVSAILRNIIIDSPLISDELSIVLLSVSFLLVSLVCIWITSKELNKISDKEQLHLQNFRMSIEASPSALILTGKDNKIRYVNRKTEKLFGRSREDLIGKGINVFLPEDMQEKIIENRKRFFLNEAPVYYDLEDDIYCITKNERRFPVEVVITPIHASEGTLALTSLTDVTEKKLNQEIIQDQMRELQHRNMQMEQFNFIASHDLQEPLRTVSNYIMLLEEDYPEQIDGEVKDHLQSINDAVFRMKKLITTLLDFSTLGRGKNLVATDVKLVITDVLADLRSLLKENGAIVSYNPEELPYVYAYETELRLLFQNLINNAVKFSKKGVLPEINIKCRAIFGYYEFTVTDNGIGIAPKHLEDIFNIFQRLHTAEEYKGYGIGLANCKKIAEMHGGKIWVESEPGKGSSFIFTILNLKV